MHPSSRIVFLEAALALLLTLLPAASGTAQGGSAHSLDPLLAHLPADATVVVLVRDLSGLAEDLDLSAAADARSETDPEFREVLTALGVAWGFDPTDLGTLADAGVDLSSPLGAAFRWEGAAGWSTALFAAAADPEPLGVLVRRLAEEHGKPLAPTAGRGGRSEDGTLRYGFSGRYLVAVSSAVAETTEARFERLVSDHEEAAEVARESLLDAPWFEAQRRALDGAWQVAAVGRLGDRADGLPAALPMEDLATLPALVVQSWKDLDSFGARLRVTPDELTPTSRVQPVEPFERPLDAAVGAAEDRLVTEIPGRAEAGLRWAVDLQEAVRIWTEDHFEPGGPLAQWEQMLQGVLGFNPRLSLLPHLGSPLFLAWLDEGADSPPGLALWVPVQAGHDLATVLADLYRRYAERGLPVARETLGEDAATWYSLDLEGPTVRWSLTRGHLVFSFGQTTPQSIAEGLAKNDEASLLSTASASVGAGLTGGRDGYGFVHIPALLRFFEGAPFMDFTAEERPVVDNLGLLDGWVDHDADSSTVQGTLRARRDGGIAEALRTLYLLTLESL